MKLTIGYLYPDLMNIYGDIGNIIALRKRAEWRGIEVEVKNISVGDSLDTSDVSSRPDIYFFGGGQDQAQSAVAADLGKSEPFDYAQGKKGKVIKQEVERGVPLLAICGGYQLLGEYYLPAKGSKLPGVGLFPAYTVASDQRMIGNIVVKMDNGQWTMDNSKKHSPLSIVNSQLTLVGFENHSGKTYLENGAKPLGKVKTGFGNNGEDQTEGCIYKNAIGCYMHGSLLPKNPELADWLIQKALEVKYGRGIKLDPLDDSIESQAHITAVQKFS